MLARRLLLLVYALGAAAAATSSHKSDVVEAHVTVEGDAAVTTRDDVSRVAPPTEARHREVPTTSESDSTNVQSQASLVVFQQELELLETLVDLQVRKLHTLEKMRTSLVADPGGPVGQDDGANDEASRRRQRTQQASRRELQDAVERKLEVVAARVLAEGSAMLFDSFFIEKAIVPMHDVDDVVGVKMGKLKSLPTHDLVVVASHDGTVRVLLSSGFELLRLDTQPAPLISVQLETGSEPPLLVVLSGGDPTTTRLSMFALDVQLDNMSTLANSEARRLVTVRSVTARELPLAPMESAITAMAIARSARRSLLCMAHADGTLGFYALNGTRVHAITTHASQIQTLVTHRNVIAFANGTSVVLLPMTSQKHAEYETCHGSLANVTSIVFDPVMPDLLYAGTHDGELLTFRLPSHTDTPLLRHCTLSHRLVVARTKPLTLAVFKGFVAVATGTELVLFNVTRSSTDGAVRLTRTCSTATASSSRATGRIAVAVNGHATVLSVVTVDDAGAASLLILQSLLPNSDALGGEPNLWRGATILIMLVVAVLTAKYCLRRQKDSDRFDGVTDGDKWRDLLEKHGRSSTVGEATTASSQAAPSKDQYLGDPTMYNATPDTFRRPSSRHKHWPAEQADVRQQLAEAQRETFDYSFDDTDDEA